MPVAFTAKYSAPNIPLDEDVVDEAPEFEEVVDMVAPAAVAAAAAAAAGSTSLLAALPEGAAAGECARTMCVVPVGGS
jgi:hypothetical protein